MLSRFWAPWAGIDEDPVTGSAHSILGLYWSRRRLGGPSGPGGPVQLRARQCSARGGELLLTVREAEARVTVAGHAVIVVKGHLLLPGKT